MSPIDPIFDPEIDPSLDPTTPDALAALVLATLTPERLAELAAAGAKIDGHYCVSS